MAVEEPETLTLGYRWGGVEGTVAVELGVNRDPAALGCADFARGFPYCRATVGPPARGYGEALGWVQLIEWPPFGPGFQVDTYMPLGKVPHPFNFFGFAPTMFDAPHTDEPADTRFLAHSFLCGLGGELFDFEDEAKPQEVRAILGFSWGYVKRGGEVEIIGLEPLGPGAWDGHRDYLHSGHPGWSFAAGFREGPLGG
jgi:hypothetical protein